MLLGPATRKGYGHAKNENKATAKRFKVTGKGKLRRRKQGSSHLKRKMSKRSKREMRQDVETDPVNVKRIERLLGRRFRRG